MLNLNFNNSLTIQKINGGSISSRHLQQSIRQRISYTRGTSRSPRVTISPLFITLQAYYFEIILTSLECVKNTTGLYYTHNPSWPRLATGLKLYELNTLELLHTNEKKFCF